MAPPTKSSRTKLITLSLSRLSLLKFPHESSASSADPQSPAHSTIESSVQNGTGVGTPDPSAGALVNGNGSENGLMAKPGLKRSASQATLDDPAKVKPRPGPKKKIRPDGPNGVPAVSTAKINPKASAGAINANLRALDRSGAQCRKWKRAPFQVKSFTGAAWYSASTWEAPAKPKRPLDEDGNPINSSASGSNTPSDAAKANRDSSAVASERSQNGDTILNGIAASSPAPVAVT